MFSFILSLAFLSSFAHSIIEGFGKYIFSSDITGEISVFILHGNAKERERETHCITDTPESLVG
jgi:hypothetical protein